MVMVGPGPLFLLQLALFWTGVTLIALSLNTGTSLRILFVLAAAAVPVYCVLFSFVASDVMLIAVLTCVVGIIVQADGGHRRLLHTVALALLFLALLLRKNALPAVFPLLLYIFLLQSRESSSSHKLLRSMVIAIPVMLAMVIGGSLLERTVDRRVTIFAGTALWDLAAISLETNEVLLPPESHGPGLTVEDLRDAFVPYANTTIFERTRAGMRQPFLNPDDPLNAAIRSAWIDAIVEHPSAYAAHRWRVTRALFGTKQADWPRELNYVVGEYQYDGNPPVASNTGRVHERVLRIFDILRSTVVLAAWPYVVLALIAAVVAWRRRSEAHVQAALAVFVSGLLYALPLVVIAPSAEFRYLGWTCLSTILGVALATPRIDRGLTTSRSATTLRAPLQNEAVLRGPLQ
jgi:hypothetical protein